MGGLAREVWPRTSARGSAAAAVRAELVEEWLRVSAETGAPLDPLIWAEGPLRTTYPACMAVQGGSRAGARTAAIATCGGCGRGSCASAEARSRRGAGRGGARQAGLDVERFRLDLRSHAITEAFGADLEATAALAAGQGARPAAVLGGRRRGGAADRGLRGRGRPASGRRPAAATRRTGAAARGLRSATPGAAPLDVEEVVAQLRPGHDARGRAAVRAARPARRAELWGLAEQWQLRAGAGADRLPVGGRA